MKINTLINRLFALAIVSVPLYGGTLLAEEAEDSSPLTLDLGTAFLSDYMFRGLNLYDGTSIQPEAALTYDFGDFLVSTGIWMHLSAEGDRQEEKFFELDNSLEVTVPLGNLTLSGGHLWYSYPRDSDEIKNSAEFFATVSYDDSEVNQVFALNPTFAYYRDYRDFDSNYFELGLSHEFVGGPLGDSFNVTPSVSFGFGEGAEKYYEANGLNHINVGLSTDLPWGDLTMSPTANYSFEFDDNCVNEFWLGFSVGYSTTL